VGPHAHWSFIWHKPRATLCSWLALAYPDYSASPLPMRHLTIFTTTRDRRRVGQAGGAQGELTKAPLASHIRQVMKRSAFGSGCGGGAHGHRPVSALLSGRLASFSSGRLMRLPTALGHQVDITFRTKPRNRAHDSIRVIAEAHA
jgi:hypothetical protein